MTFLVSDITYLKKDAIAIRSQKKPDLHVLKIGKFSAILQLVFKRFE
jgi:hypothetical protein